MKKFIDLLAVKVKANLRTEVSRYYLNYLWWVIEPVLTMLTFYLVFAVFLERGTEHFVAFLLVGLIPWQWFSNCVIHSSNSILNGKSLMLQVNISKIFFPLEVIIRDTFKHLFVLTLLLIFLIFYPTPVSMTWIALPVLMAVQMLFVTGVGILCAAVVPFIPDMHFVIATVVRLAMYGSGIFYSIDAVILPEHRVLMYMNPMAGLIRSYREILMYSKWPDWGYLGCLTLGGAVLLCFAMWLLFRFDRIYPRVCHK